MKFWFIRTILFYHDFDFFWFIYYFLIFWYSLPIHSFLVLYYPSILIIFCDSQLNMTSGKWRWSIGLRRNRAWWWRSRGNVAKSNSRKSEQSVLHNSHAFNLIFILFSSINRVSGSIKRRTGVSLTIILLTYIYTFFFVNYFPSVS